MSLKKCGAYTLLAGAFFYFGCNNDNTKSNQSSATDSSNAPVSRLIDSVNKAAKMFALPAPMQVVTMLKNANIMLGEKSLVPAKQPGSFSSEYIKALHLGIYSVDLGYLIAYEQRQSALNYYKTINDLLSSLSISPNVLPSTLKRFEKNVSNTDSLSSIILQSFEGWQNYFQENKREEVGLYIISGSYVEGLYLSLLQADKNQSTAFKNLIGQQKLFLDNILELSNYMDRKVDFDDLYSKLGPIQDAYSLINVSVNDGAEDQSTVVCTYTPDQINTLLKKVTEVRSSIIK